jgi:hypothetical protein
MNMIVDAPGTRPNTVHNSTDYTVPSGKALVLRVCQQGRWSDGQEGRPKFTWPGVGELVEAPDWQPTSKCGYGLHGWLWGVGDVDASGAAWGFTEEGVTWLVVEVELADVIAVDGRIDSKVKFPRGRVVFEGPGKDAALFIQTRAPAGSKIILGTATAGYAGTATAGTRGTATAGDAGTATAGTRGTATAGEDGVLIILRWDPIRNKYRKVIGEVGENGIEANVPYILDEHGKLIKKPTETK